MRHLAFHQDDSRLKGSDFLAKHFLFPEHALLAHDAKSAKVLAEIYDEQFPGNSVSLYF